MGASSRGRERAKGRAERSAQSLYSSEKLGKVAGNTGARGYMTLRAVSVNSDERNLGVQEV